MKKTKMDPESSHFKILRNIVIALQDQYDEQELTLHPVKKLKARLDKASKELQEVCRHERVAELMSSWSPKKTPKVKFVFSNGRVCLDCGLEELVSEMNCLFYRILPKSSFFTNFSEVEKFTKFGGIEKQNFLENFEKSKLVFRKLGDLLEENLKKEGNVTK
ncbi:MAG: hypothetical protein AAB497_00100 [Patescibacteria group bacterium]